MDYHRAVRWRSLLAEFLGSAFLAAVVIGSGIAAQRLSPGDVGLELFENAAATAAGLYTIILMFGPVSGAHFNPVVTLVDASFGGMPWRRAAAYVPAQVAGCVAGAVLANGMFAVAAVSVSAHHRASPSHLLAEVVATLGLCSSSSRSRAHDGTRPHPPRSARTSARPTSSPARRASPTRRSASAGCSRTRSPGSRPLRYRVTWSRSSSAPWGRSSCSARSTRDAFDAADVVLPHPTTA